MLCRGCGFTGNVGDGMREGDTVIVLYGSHWPFVPVFLLLGHCYVNGMTLARPHGF